MASAGMNPGANYRSRVKIDLNSERYILHRQNVDLLRRIFPKYGVVSFYGPGNFIR